MRASLIATIALLLVTTCAFVACERDGEDESDSIEDRIRSPQEDLEGLVVFGGDIEITIDDVDKAVHRLRLLAPEVQQGEIPDGDPQWMKNPMAQINVVRNLLRFRIVRKAAAARNIELNAADETAFLAEHEPLSRYLPLLQNGEDADQLRQELADADLELDDIRHLVHDMVLEEKLEDALAEEFSKEKLWGMYQQVYDEADVVVVSIANTPKSHEIDRAIEQYDAEIRAHYRENRARYTRPRQAQATLLRPASEEASDLEEAAQRLSDGDDPEEIADEFELVVESGVTLSPKTDPKALEADEGDVGTIDESPRGPHVWRIDEVEEAQTRQLDRPLRREIGSQVLREQEGITPANREEAQNAARLLGEAGSGALDEDDISDLVDRLEEEGFNALHTDFFSVHGSGVLPQIGLAEGLFEAIGQLELDDPVTEPILDRNDIHIARLVRRNHPDRDSFEEDYDEFREEFIEANRHRLVDDYVRNYKLEHEVNFHIAAVSEHFGTMDHQKQKMPAPPEEPVPAEEFLEQ